MNPSRHSGRGRLPSVLALGAFAATLQAQPSGVAFDYRSELKLPHPATVIARGVPVGYLDGEAGWILEDNLAMRAPIESMGSRVSKRYRLYETPPA